MKKQILLLAAIAAVLSACDWGAVNEHTPQIAAGFFRLNPVIQADTIAFEGDTLYRHLDTKTGATYFDTIAVGDSVRFMAELYAYYNELTGFEVQYDSTQLSVWIPVDSALRQALLPGSRPEAGKLVIKPDYNYASLAVWYRPLKSGNADVTLIVTSNSQFSEYGIGFQQRVR